MIYAMNGDATRDYPVLFELLAIPAVLLLGVLGARWPYHAALRRRWARLANRRGAAVVLVGATALLACLGSAAIGGWPLPEFHDEFAYLLAADTYAHGRLTNPPHPLWPHFESFHIVQQPTCMAKYPPGQGLVLAAGQVLGGQPAVGVWLSFTLACMATCWMLQAWLPPRWALLGGLLTALHPGLLLHWGQTYWGGAVAMLGGALVFGAVRRLLRQPRIGLAVALGSGLVLLALSRPLEGLVCSLPAAVVLLAWAGGRAGPPLPTFLFRVALPVALVLGTGIAFWGYANFRVTGSPGRLPYQVHEEIYGLAPILFWQTPRAMPAYRHEAIRALQTGWALEQYTRHWPLANLPRVILRKLTELWRFSFQASLGVAVVVLPWLWRERWVRLALLTIGLVVAVVVQITWFFPHYAAPVTCLVSFVVVQGLRQVRAGGRRWPALRRFVPLLLLVFLLSLAVAVGTRESPAWVRQRAHLQTHLTATGERHLVVVRYGPHHLPYKEWVYNGANIDASPVVWARDMGTGPNQALLDYFRHRRAWLLEVDDGPAVLTAYPAPP